MLAEITPSNGLTDPVSWATLADKVGVGGVFGIIILVGGGWLVWKLGNKIFDRWDLYLSRQEANTGGIGETLKTHLSACDRIHAAGGASNLTDIRKASGHALTGLHAIAKEIAPEAMDSFAKGLDALRERGE